MDSSKFMRKGHKDTKTISYEILPLDLEALEYKRFIDPLVIENKREKEKLMCLYPQKRLGSHL